MLLRISRQARFPCREVSHHNALTNFEGIKQKDKELFDKQPKEKLLNPHLADNIDAMMRIKKPHLQNDITIEVLAEILEISVKDLSMLINRHFNKNFWEFINNYRIDEAKQLLSDGSHNAKSITDIYLEVGFNSKSDFNTFFKKTVGVTPCSGQVNLATI